jgi:GNAT superfamily N-acetyltransferase
MKIRSLRPEEWSQLAHLIFHSTNQWYQKNLNRSCFPGDDPTICRLFPEVYESLDPGCSLVAECEGTLAGSCFYHPRETHVSLGIMNVHPDFAGQGVARRLLEEIIRIAGAKPLRLVSSALNLDSFSLYSRAGFRPYEVYQDMILPNEAPLLPVPESVRPATPEDLPALLALEEEISGIRRSKDWEHFLENQAGHWHGLVSERKGSLNGFLFSIKHPGSCMLGPGVMRGEEEAASLIAAQLRHFGDLTPVFLVPSRARDLLQTLYRWGARNCEIHLAQVRGEAKTPDGIVMPTFMPETG